MLRYRAIMHRENGCFWVEVPDFPEITYHGMLDDEDPVDSMEGTLADAIVLRLEEGEPLPEPSALINNNDNKSEQFLIIPRKKRISIEAK